MRYSRRGYAGRRSRRTRSYSTARRRVRPLRIGYRM
jgi:hypothetical protein